MGTSVASGLVPVLVKSVSDLFCLALDFLAMKDQQLFTLCQNGHLDGLRPRTDLVPVESLERFVLSHSKSISASRCCCCD